MFAVLTALILLATGCKKEGLDQIQKQKPEEVNFNFANYEIRDTVYENPQKTEAGFKAAQLRGQSTSNVTGNPTRVIWVRNGGTISNSNWNNGVAFYVAPIDQSIFTQGLNIARNHHAMFNFLITTDSTVFAEFDIWHRTIVVVGNSEIFGPYPGYSWLNSYLWGDDTPAFVLANNCNPNAMISDIGHLIAHESAHQFGIQHEYITWGNQGAFLSGASIMGNFAQRTFINWTSGNIVTLTQILGVKDDDFKNSINTWVYNQANVGKPLCGVLTSGDIDVGRFYPSATSKTIFTITSGGDAPVSVELWLNGVKKFILNTNGAMSASKEIPKGTAPYMMVIKISNTNCRHTTWSTNKTQG